MARFGGSLLRPLTHPFLLWGGAAARRPNADIPWMMFGSSELETNPDSLVDGLLYRTNMSTRGRRACTSCLCEDVGHSDARHRLGDTVSPPLPWPINRSHPAKAGLPLISSDL